MTLYASVLAFLAIVALYCTYSLNSMRREAHKLILAIRAEETAARELRMDAEWIYERAREAYADANARWMSLVRLEGRVH